MSTAIEFNHVSKQYRLGVVSTKTLSHDLDRWWKVNVLRQEDPYLKIGSINDRSTAADSEYVWALRDIDFKVEQGDVVGIIGKNGAGKSTLLKLLSKITAPSLGTINARGRIGALLEVGTGFHPEMTGRENVFLNGAILGMSKAEINSKLDEIIDFSGCERYIDTPVKRYSSGMMVRLGFAVASHLDPEIMVVDEVLAVGDAEFQKKAIGKMQDVSKGEGRTVLFVSHNMNAVRNLCKSGVVLSNGSVDYIGSANDAVDYYMGDADDQVTLFKEIDASCRMKDLPLFVEFVSIGFKADKNTFAQNEDIEFAFVVRGNRQTDECRINATILGLDDVAVGSVSNTTFFKIGAGDVKKVTLRLYNHNLAYGEYKVSFSIGSGNLYSGQRDYDIVCNVLRFKINPINSIGKNELVVEWPHYWGHTMLPSETILEEI